MCSRGVSIFPFFAERGIATAEVVSGWLTTILLFTALVRRGHFDMDRPFAFRLIRLVAAAAVMAGALEYASTYAAPYITPQSPLIHQVGAVLGLILVAMIVYFGTAFAIGGASLGMLRRNLKRKPGAPAEPSAPGED
jgi:putative peptidoglycan lipid II flippase